MVNSNEYMREYMRDRYARRRGDALEYLGGKCFECGSVKDLQFDHINPDDKEFAIGKLFAGANENKLYKELNKCQLLCVTCHKNKSKKEEAHGNKNRQIQCPKCFETFSSTKSYAGHRRWCNHV